MSTYEHTKKYRSSPKNKIKRNARRRVEYQIKMGYLKRGDCVICGQKNAQAHHPNHNKPLDIIWLCVSHHRSFEKQYKNKKQPKEINILRHQIRCDNCEILLRFAPKGNENHCGDCLIKKSATIQLQTSPPQ